VTFVSEEQFQREYSQNIANGGIFISSEETFELREILVIEIDLLFCDERVQIEGEVVSIVQGLQPGVAVQFQESASSLRDRLGSLAGIGSARRAEGVENPWRAAIRHTVRVYARIECDGKVLGGCTRDLSQSGVLVMVDGPLLPVGTAIRVTLTPPLGGEEFNSIGRIVRHVSLEGGRKALGILFEWGEENSQLAVEFLKRLREMERPARGGDIWGDIAAIGVPNILQMLASSTPKGTVLLYSGNLLGRVLFEDGAFVDLRVGEVTGAKALARMCEWTEGEFTFSLEIDPDEAREEEAIPVYGALLEAAAQVDEVSRSGAEAFPPGAQLVYCPGSHPGFVADGQIEEALVELAQAGFKIANVLDIIPEADAIIYKAISKLSDLGIIKVDS